MFIFLILLNQSYADVLVLKTSNDHLSIGKYLEYLEDSSNSLTIQEVSSDHYHSKYIANEKERINFGYTQSSYWVRFKVKTAELKHWYLLLDRPIFGSTQAYLQPVVEAGEPKAEFMQMRPESHRTPLYDLSLPKNKIYSVYLRVNNGNAILDIPLKVMTSKTLMKHSNWQYAFFMFIFGGIIILFLYNFFLLLSLRDISYISLNFLIFSLFWLFYQDANLLPQLGFLNHSNSVLFSVPIIFAFASGLEHWRTIIEKKSVMIDRMLFWSARMTIFSLFLAIYFDQFNKFFYLMILGVTPLFFILLIWQLEFIKNLALHDYLAVAIFLVGSTPYIIYHAGILDDVNDLDIYFFESVVLLALLLLSLTQAAMSRKFRKQADQALASNKIKDEILLTMSHELRTPMNAILGCNTLLETTSSQEVKHDLLFKQKIAAKHMLLLINKILDSSSVKYDALKLKHHAFTVLKVKEKLEGLFVDQAKYKGLSLKIELSGSQADQILLGDETRLLQVLINLIGNALKFTQKGGVEVTIRQVSHKNNAVRYFFAVKDTGEGIKKEQQANLFKPFTQLDSSRSRKHEGTGLCLSISNQLVSLMGGRLVVESEVGKGSCFKFTIVFPLQQSSSEKQLSSVKATKNKPQPCLKVKVLLVDDNDLNLFVAVEQLKAIGVDASSVTSGKEAIAILQKETFDLVFMDISMPEMDGYEATQKIRRKLRLKNLPVVALTAHRLEGEHKRCLEAGMNGVVIKPFDIDDLAEAINKNVDLASLSRASNL